MKLKTKDLVLVSLFTALTAIGGFIYIPLGNVPFTMQTLFTILSGIILGPTLGALSQLVYVLLGLAGLPIFAGFSGGISSIFHPTFGFILGFIVASYITGKLSSSNKSKNFSRYLLATLIGTIVIYIFGIPYLYFIFNNYMGVNMSWSAALKSGCIIFLPTDILKAVLASLLARKIDKAV